jgi:hypothetical protein
VKRSKSAAEPPQMLREVFGEHSLSRTAVFDWHSHFKAVSLKKTSTEGDQAPSKWQEMWKNFDNPSMKTAAEQSMSSQTPLGSVIEFARS